MTIAEAWGQALALMLAWPPVTPLDVELCWLPLVRAVRSRVAL
jgi:hypothetical protein